MKKQMLPALWIYFAFQLITPVVKAGNDQVSLRDTLILVPDTNFKIVLIGGDMKVLATYNRLDSLKMMLIADVAKAEQQSNYPVAPRTTHYFVDENGKRRLKTESEDFLEQEINVEKEKTSLRLGLYSFVYIIHDLAMDYEIQIYMKDPRKLKSLLDYNLNEAISSISADKGLQRNSFRINLEKEKSQWAVKENIRKREDLLEISPVFGAGLIGNQWSPAVGGDVFLQLTNKYALPTYRLGAGLLGYTFAESNNFDFSNINFVQGYSFKAMRNISSRNNAQAKPRWVGLSGGIMKTSQPGILNKTYKAGFIGEGFGSVNFSFDVIFLKHQKSIYGLTLLIPF